MSLTSRQYCSDQKSTRERTVERISPTVLLGKCKTKKSKRTMMVLSKNKKQWWTQSLKLSLRIYFRRKAANRSQLAAGVDKDLAKFSVLEPLDKFESVTLYRKRFLLFWGTLRVVLTHFQFLSVTSDISKLFPFSASINSKGST